MIAGTTGVGASAYRRSLLQSPLTCPVEKAAEPVISTTEGGRDLTKGRTGRIIGIALDTT